MGWIPKISIACISCTSYQQTRPIFSSRQHWISTKLGMQHHTYLLPSLIISSYISTELLLCYMFSKSHNAHITFIFGHFTVYAYHAYQNSDIFLQKKPLNFHFKTRNHFRDEITRLVMNTRLFRTLKNVDMFKIVEFYRFMHSAFCGWKRFKIFIMHSLEDGFVLGVRFSKWWPVQYIVKCKY